MKCHKYFAMYFSVDEKICILMLSAFELLGLISKHLKIYNQECILLDLLVGSKYKVCSKN